MSDSVDRVFVHALATVRRLPRTGSSRPPPAARLRLYGLYKQSMEGDVLSILARPTLPPLSPDPSSNTVHRYASRDLRAREAQGEIEKWDAWQACQGMSRTEAKRRYISTLIDTMKEYASGTQESRELVSELEFVWNQIRSQSGSSDEGEGNGDSPNRRLERAGLKQTYNTSRSYASIPPGSGSGPGGGDDDNNNNANNGNRPTTSDPNRMRVLSPVSVNEGEESKKPSEGQQPIPSPLDQTNRALIPLPNSTLNPPPNTSQSRHQTQELSPHQTYLETHLHQLSTEIAALREQLSSNNLLSHSTYSTSIPNLSPWQRVLWRMSNWFKWLIWAATRQTLVNLGVLVVLVLWGRVRGDRRVEAWIGRRWRDLIRKGGSS